MVGLSVRGDVVGQPNAYMLDKTNGANVLTIALGQSMDILNHVLGEFLDLSAKTDLRKAARHHRRDRQADHEDGARPDRGDRHPHVRGDRQRPRPRGRGRGGTGFLWEINGTDGTLRITAEEAQPQIFPLTVAGARGRNEPAELAVPAALTQRWPELTSLELTPAYNIGRAYAVLAADIDNGTHTVPDFTDAVRLHEGFAAIERSAASGERVKV